MAKEQSLDDYRVDDTLDMMESGTVAKNTVTVKSGFMRLDRLLNNGRGFAPATVIIGGEAGSGKTTYAMQIADKIASSKTLLPDGREVENDVLIFSLEMSRADLVARSLSKQTALYAAYSRGAGLNALDIGNGAVDTTSVKWAIDYILKSPIDGGFSDEQKTNLSKAYANYRANIAPHLFVYEPKVGEHITAEIIEREIKKFVDVRGRAPVVFLDYLQLLKTDDPEQTDKKIIDDTMNQLSVIKKNYGTTIFCISALNRLSYGKESNLGGFRESSSIEYSSDIALTIELLGQNKKGFDKNVAMGETPRKMVVRLLKNRQGPMGTSLHYNYYSAYNVFEECAPREYASVDDDDEFSPI